MPEQDRHEPPTRRAAQPPTERETAPERKSPVARNVITNWLWYGLVVISGFLLPRFIDTYEGKELLGVWDFSWSLVFYLSLLAVGLVSAVNRNVARHRATQDWDALNKTVTVCLGLLSGSFVVSLGLIVLFVGLVPRALPDSSPDVIHTAQWVVALLSISAALKFPLSVFNGIITGYERYDLLNLIRGIRDALLLATMIGVLMLGYGLTAVALATLVAEVLADLVKLVLVPRLCPHLRISPRYWSWRTAKEMLAYGGKTLLQATARGGLYHTNSLLVAFFLGPGTLAVYSRQRSLLMHATRFLNQYSIVFIPSSSSLHARQDLGGLRELLIHSSRYGFFAALPIVTLFIVMGGPLLQLWMGPNYAAPTVLTILAAGHILSLAQPSVFSVLMGMGCHGLPAVLELGVTICSIIAGYLVLAVFDGGMESAAYTVAIPLTIGSGLILPLYACRLLGMNPVKYAMQVLPGPLLAVLPFAACLVIARLVWPTPLVALGAGAGGGGIVIALIYWRWVVPSGVKSRMYRLFKR